MGPDQQQVQRHTGLVEPNQIPRYLLAIDVLAHPSYREGLPRAVVQGLLSGAAAVVYDVDGAKEACDEGQFGRLVPPGDFAALREAVTWMLDHPDERREMGRRGRALCQERFAASAMVDRLEAVYASVLGLTADGPGGSASGGG